MLRRSSKGFEEVSRRSREGLEKVFEEREFIKSTAGMSSAHDIMKEFIITRCISTRPASKPAANNDDIFTMVGVLAKSNAVNLTAPGRSQHHKKIIRALTSEVNDIKSVKEKYR